MQRFHQLKNISKHKLCAVGHTVCLTAKATAAVLHRERKEWEVTGQEEERLY